jgi:hypothetical protein
MFPIGITAPAEPLHYRVLQYGQFPLGAGPCRCYSYRVQTHPSHTMHRLPVKPFAAIALGCLLGFGLVDLARQDRRALAHCEQRGGSVAECRLVVSGR